jgi:hypothetical protein
MAGIPFVNDIDLRGNEILNARVPRLNGLPGVTADMNGWIVYNTQDNRYYVARATAWIKVPENLDGLEGVTATSLRDRSTHTGSQGSDTINDFRAAVNASRLDQFAAPTADVGMGGRKLTNLAAGTASTDAITKAQLDAVDAKASANAAGITIKTAVRAVLKANTAQTGLITADGVTLAAGDRYLRAVGTEAANGIWIVAAGAHTRATDADGANELASGTLVSVREGSTEADSLWALITDSATGAVTPGTTAHSWSRALAGANGEIIVAGNGITKTGTTIAVQPKAGGFVTVDASGVDVNTGAAGLSKRAEGQVAAGQASVAIAHNLGLKYVDMRFYETATGVRVYPVWTPTSASGGTAEFKTAPTAGQYDWAAST